MKRVFRWIRIRFGLDPLNEVLRHRVTKTKFYYGDGATLIFLFGILIFTGAFLGLNYSPSPDTAYESVTYITHRQWLGWFVRGLHYWSAGMMIVILAHHVLRHILLGGYLAPREGTWLTGIGLFWLVIVNSFIGYTLRWSEDSVSAIRVALNMFYQVPIVGSELVWLIQGSDAPGASTLSRFYAVHVIIVPLLLIGLLGYHLYLVIMHGVTTLAEQKNPPASGKEQILLHLRLKESSHTGEDFFPHTMARSGIFTLLVFSLVILLVILVGPPDLSAKAGTTYDPIPKEEWWFHWYSALIAYLPHWLAPIFYVVFPFTILLALFSLPFLDRSHNRGIRRRPLAVLSVLILVTSTLVLTAIRMKSPWMAWPDHSPTALPEYAKLSPSASKGRAVFSRSGCLTCHSIGGIGSQFGPNLTDLKARLSRSELIRYIQAPPDGVPMPAYEARLTEAELNQVVDFVLAIQTLPREL